MQYFTEQAGTHGEAIEKIRLKYGERAKILTQRSVRTGGVLGLFTREGVELTGYISETPGRARKMDLEEEKRKILATVKGDQTLQQVLQEVQDIKEQLSGDTRQSGDRHPSISKIEDLLVENDFTLTYIRDITERLKRELSFEELDDYSAVKKRVAKWIADGIHTTGEIRLDEPQVVILVGPTGVGKTTTIAKLAAVFGLGAGGAAPKSVRMITIDNYRIGAKKQIETYGDIMGIPVACVENYQELDKKLMLFKDSDLILIDTIGKSPNDYRKLADMREMLGACGSRATVCLTVSATTKGSDLEEIMQQFEPFGYESIILTKLDETARVGNIISVVSKRAKPLSFFTDGQMVPQDIKVASPEQLLVKLEGLDIDRESLLQRDRDRERDPIAPAIRAEERG